jgi:hypothetical protein
MRVGQNAEAAALFEKLAEKAERLSHHRAPQLYLQAGRAWIAANQTGRGLNLLIRALQSMADMGQFQRLPMVSRRVLENLQSKGLDEIASSFEAKAKEILATHNLTMASKIESHADHRLPGKCNSCGGNVHPEEVEWSGKDFVACAYCGSKLEIEV